MESNKESKSNNMDGEGGGGLNHCVGKPREGEGVRVVMFLTMSIAGRKRGQ